MTKQDQKKSTLAEPQNAFQLLEKYISNKILGSNDQAGQVCFVMIESLSHTTDDLIFKWNFTNPLYVSPEIQLPQVKYSKYHRGGKKR